MKTTKSLTESINEVKNMMATKDEKVACLVKLGIPSRECARLFRVWEIEGVNVNSSAFSYTFGIELECGVRINDVRSASVSFLDRSNRYEHIHRDVFSFQYDSSVHVDNACECVSPVLNSVDGMDKVKACCEALNNAGARVDKTCGFHVHIGDCTNDEQYSNVFVNYMYCERVIDTFMAKSRRDNNSVYAKTLIGKGLEYCHTKHEVRSALSTDRYRKVNCATYLHNHNTIEFRQHQGTTDYTKIKNWVEFCARLVEWSMTHRMTQEVTSVDEIPFLTQEQKEFFNGRVEEFKNRENGGL